MPDEYGAPAPLLDRFAGAVESRFSRESVDYLHKLLGLVVTSLVAVAAVIYIGGRPSRIINLAPGA